MFKYDTVIPVCVWMNSFVSVWYHQERLHPQRGAEIHTYLKPHAFVRGKKNDNYQLVCVTIRINQSVRNIYNIMILGRIQGWKIPRFLFYVY